jgi:hypothetical protein
MQSPWVASQDYKFSDMATPKLSGDGDLGRETLLKEELTPPPGLSERHLAQSTVHQGMGLEGPNGTAAQEQGNLLEVPKYFQDSPDQVNELVTQSPGSEGEVNRSVNQHNYNMQFGQVTAMGGSMPKRQRTSGGTYATMACQGGPFGTPPMHRVSRMFPDSTGGEILDIFTPYHVGRKRKYAEFSDASMGSNSDESENSPGVQGILGEALRSSKRLATMMSMKEFQAGGSGGEQAGNQAEVEKSLELSANCLAGMLGIPLPYPAKLTGDVGVGSRDPSLTNDISDSPSSISIPAPTSESFLMAPITTSEIECRHVLHPCNPPSKSVNSTIPSIPRRLGRIVKELSRTIGDRPMWENSSTVGGSVHQDDPVDSHMDEVLGTGTQEESFLANPLLTPPLSPQNDISSELEYVQSNSLSPAIPLHYSTILNHPHPVWR